MFERIRWIAIVLKTENTPTLNESRTNVAKIASGTMILVCNIMFIELNAIQINKPTGNVDRNPKTSAETIIPIKILPIEKLFVKLTIEKVGVLIFSVSFSSSGDTKSTA